MTKEFYKHKRNDCIKWVAVFLAIILLAVGVIAALTQGFKSANAYCWLGHDYDENGICTRCGAEKPLDDIVVDLDSQSGFESTSVNNNGIRLLSAVLPNANVQNVLDQYGNGDNWVLTAEIENDDAANKRMTWSVRWKTAPWGSGNVTDYVTVTPREDGGLVADVQCLADFGMPIEVVVASEADPNCYATCLFDYVERVRGLKIICDKVRVGSYCFSVEYDCSNYTIPSEKNFEADSTYASIGSITSTLQYAYSGDFATKFSGALINGPEFELVSNYGNNKDWKIDILNPSPNWWFHVCPGYPVSLDSDSVEVLGDKGWQRYFAVKKDSSISADEFRQILSEIVKDREDICLFNASIRFTSTYEGKVYSSGRCNIPLYVPTDDLHFGVGDVSISDTHIIV